MPCGRGTCAGAAARRTTGAAAGPVAGALARAFFDAGTIESAASWLWPQSSAGTGAAGAGAAPPQCAEAASEDPWLAISTTSFTQSASHIARTVGLTARTSAATSVVNRAIMNVPLY